MLYFEHLRVHTCHLHHPGRKRQHFEKLLGSQLVCGKAKHPGGDGLPGFVHQNAGVAVKFDCGAVLALILLLCLQDDGVVHLLRSHSFSNRTGSASKQPETSLAPLLPTLVLCPTI